MTFNVVLFIFIVSMNKWTLNCEKCNALKTYSSLWAYEKVIRNGGNKLVLCRSCANRLRWKNTIPGQRSKYASLIWKGKKFGNLTVISDKIGEQTQVDCQCKCGNIIKKRATRLIGGGNDGCKKCLLKDKNHLWKGIGKVPKIVLTRIKHHAKHKNRDFDLTLEYVSKMFDNQHERCAISGLPIQFGSSNEEQTASLDRIDSSRGYVKGNVQWVHKNINWMKQDFSEHEFLSLCKYIVNFRKL